MTGRRESAGVLGELAPPGADCRHHGGLDEMTRRMLDALAEGHEPDPFLGRVVRAVADQLAADSAALWLSEDDGSPRFRLEVDRAGSILTAAEVAPLGEHHPFGASAGRDGLDSLGPPPGVGYRLIEDVAEDPRLGRHHAALAARGVRALLLLPLFLGRERLGTICLRYREPRPLRGGEVELAPALGRLATLAIRLVGLADGARASGIAQERDRMAREIHDTLAQELAAILLQLEACEVALLAGPIEEARRLLDRARDQARRALTEIRHSVWALRPLELERADLASALPELLGRLAGSDPGRPSLRFRVEGRPRPLPSKVEDELLRIAQEATNNALKHARAGEICVELAFGPGKVRLAVEDDGQGMGLGIGPVAPARHDAGSGFGLIGMRDRAAVLGGCLTIGRSGRGRAGTRVLVEVPAPVSASAFASTSTSAGLPLHLELTGPIRPGGPHG